MISQSDGSMPKSTELKASSAGRRETALKALGPFFIGRLVRAIGAKEAEAWKIERGSTISARTWNIEVETLKQIFAYAKDTLRIVLDNPVEFSNGRKNRKRDRHSVERTVSRPRERAALRSSVNGGSGGPGGIPRLFGLSSAESSVRALAGHQRDTGDRIHYRRRDRHEEPWKLARFLCLASRIGWWSMRERKPPSGESLIFEIENARLQIIRACERLGFPRFGHHTMRHFFCSNAIEAGCDFKVIAGWLGHKDGGVLVAMTYGHLRSEHSAAMAKRIVFDALIPNKLSPNIVAMGKT